MIQAIANMRSRVSVQTSGNILHKAMHVRILSGGGKPHRLALGLALCLGLAMCAGIPAQGAEVDGLKLSTPAMAGFDEEKLQKVDGLIDACIKEGRTPGAVLCVVRDGKIALRRAYGLMARTPAPDPARVSSIYDLASLTKVLATTPSIMKLYEQEKLKLDDPVAHYVPEFAQNGKGKITIRQLLTHTSGLPSWDQRIMSVKNRQEALAIICREKLHNEPGSKFEYSDLGFITLGMIVEKVSGKPLNEFVQQEVHGPLGMIHTRYLPPADWRPLIAPTTRPQRGTVHDPLCLPMGGVAGHAGLFSNVEDIAIYCQMLLNGGSYGGVRIFKPETVALMTTPQTKGRSIRALGWDIGTGYSRRGKSFSKDSFGHTGFTGTCIWVDRPSKTAVILLANRVYGGNERGITRLQTDVMTAVGEALK